MSLQRGNMKKQAPKHQNTFAFKHNPKSKKTQRILSMPIHGLCEKCHQQIEWRKKYRKYKPLTQPGSCIYCHEKSVTSAYHSACDLCAKERNICAKCCLTKEIVARCVRVQLFRPFSSSVIVIVGYVCSEQELRAEHEKKEREFANTLGVMRERDRRAYVRKMEKEKETSRKGEGNGDESFDEPDEEMQ
ncbi:hypothetical protein PsorP6_005689 [Peronosclerospora sorghi]|uniref:Uncharacterized protein n=1 Tax=Peronosclerospora sorghi TaxID=230839 RepID=A0ACC0W2N4_9STRA|nr:hypothetical protein PsorP6_005689 [Peronosclerospora sorghi]